MKNPSGVRAAGAGGDVSVQVFLDDREPRTEAAPGATTPEVETGAWRERRRLGWARSQGRAIAVRVDGPDGPACGAVVVARPAGREAVVALRTTSALAHRAVAAGFVTFSFSWSSEGDSEDLAGSDDLAEAWTADLATVVRQARDLVGDELPVHIIGLRLGATIARRVLQDGPGRTVCWEPISGRSFVRYHRMIRADSVGVPVCDDGVELDGDWYSADQVASLATLRAPRSGPGVVMEADRRAALRIGLGAPYFAHVPLASIDRIVDDLPRGETRRLPSWAAETSAQMTLADGDRVVETWTAVGPRGLPAIVTTSPGVRPHLGAVFTAMGSEIKAGPGRLWARSARELAPLGLLSVRADRSLIGDDTVPDCVDEPRPYTDRSVEDVAAAAALVRKAGVPVLGVGLCAGAWSLLRAAEAGDLDEIVAVNAVHFNPHEDVYDEAFYRHYHGEEAPALAQAAAPGAEPAEADRPSLRQRWARATETASKEIAIRYPRLRSALRDDVPVDSVGMLLDAVPAGTRLDLLFGAEEHRIFAGKGGRRAAAKARRRGLAVEVTRDDALDHSLFSRAGRDRTLAALEAVVRRGRS